MTAQLAQYFQAILTPFLLLGVSIATATLILFALAATIRGILLIAESVLDEKPMSSMLAQLARGGAIAMVLMTALYNWSSVQGWSLGFVSGATTAIAAGMGHPRPQIYNLPDGPPAFMAQELATGILAGSTERLTVLVLSVHRFYLVRMLVPSLEQTNREPIPPGVDIDEWINQQIARIEAEQGNPSRWSQIMGFANNFSSSLTGVLMLGMAVCAALIFAVVALYHLMGSLLVILVALGLGPVAVALSPVQATFIRNLGATLVSGGLQFAFVANLTTLLVEVVNRVAANQLSSSAVSSGYIASTFERAASLFLMPILCIVFALLIPKVLSTISEVFSGGKAGSMGGIFKAVVGGAAAARVMKMTAAAKTGGVSAAAAAAAAAAKSGAGSMKKP